MAGIGDFLKSFINAVARSRIAVAGGVMAAIILPVLLVLGFLDLQGIVNNPYFGFLIYLVLAPLFVVGLVLLLAGIFFCRGRDDENIGLFTYEYVKEQLTRPGRFTRIRRLLFLVTGLTLATMFVVGLVTYAGVEYTDSVAFCGRFCHTVMEPQYVAYRNSPHSQVSCVDCHLSSQSGWSTRAKLSGLKQVFAVAFNTYPKPLESPISDLRPNQATCLQCHRPEMFHGDKLYIKKHFLADANTTPVQTVLLMRIGSGGYSGREAQGIHWHVSPQNTVTYRASDEKRELITEVRLRRKDGTETVYRLDGNPEAAGGGEVRVMDCIDCHNRPTHVFLTPDEALDQKLLAGLIPQGLPFIKQVALEAVTKSYASQAAARVGIGNYVRSWYKERYPDLADQRADLITTAVDGIYAAYSENVFPAMKVEWSTYRNNIGHQDGLGCFRCHDGRHRSVTGEVISNDCQICHAVLAESAPAPDVLGLLSDHLGIDN